MATLIIGGCGFIGSNIRKMLEGHSDIIYVFDRNAEPELSTNDLVFIRGDFANRGQINHIFEKCNIKNVIHLASSTIPGSSNLDPEFDVVSNLCETISLLQICVKYQIKKFIFFSSGGTVYGIPSHLPISEEHSTNPICSYGITKLAIEKYLYLFKILYNLEYIIFRVANPYGPGQLPLRPQGAIATFAYKTLIGQEINIWGDGSVVRDYIFIDDLSSLCASAIDSTVSGIFNASSGNGYSILEIIHLIENIINKKAIIKFEKSRSFDVPQIILDSNQAQKTFNWYQKIDIHEGLQKTCSWLQNFHSSKLTN